MTKRTIVGILVGASILAGACAPQHATTHSARTAVQQLIQTEAAGRAVGRLELPPLRNRPVFLRMKGVTTAGDDEAYVRQLLTTALEWRGAKIVESADEADFIATAFLGSFGTKETRSFVGLPQTQSIVIPVTTPEIALYKAVNQEGFAKVKIVILDTELNRIVHSSGPVQSEAYWHEFAIFGFNFRRTDTSWKPGSERALRRYVGRDE